jgi:hypothetical protein
MSRTVSVVIMSLGSEYSPWPFVSKYSQFIYIVLYLYSYKFMKGGEIFFVTSDLVKAVPLHAMEAQGGRGGIAPTHT